MPESEFAAIRKREGKYWAERFRLVEEVKHKDIEHFFGRIKRLFDKAYTRIDQQLHLFFAQFADVENISYAEAKQLLTDAELEDFKMDLEDYIATAERNAKYYDKQTAKELEKASLRYRVTRLESMEYHLKAYMAELFAEADAKTYEKLAETYADQYARTAFEIFKGTGVFKTDFSLPEWKSIDLLIRRPWRSDGSNFSERYGAYRTQLVTDLSDTLARVIINGEGYEGASRELSRLMGTNEVPGGALYKAKRLIHTEAAYFSGIAQNECFKELGVEKYQFSAELNLDVCDNCQEMDGQIFELKDRRVGVNAPPLHPNCVLPDTVIYAPDAEALTRSYYSGVVFKISVSDGRSFTVTPNHIMLTTRGWVRAKFLVEGDQVIYYSGWNELISSIDPTDHNCIPTIEELFTALAESSFSATETVPASPVDFKGDVVENSEVDIVFIDRFLRDKLNPAFSKFISDRPFVPAGKFNELLFKSNCTFTEFLMGTALTSDGVMSSLDVFRILFGGSPAHHKPICFGVVPDYYARLFKTVSDNVSRNTEFISESVGAHTVGIESDNFLNRKCDSRTGFKTGFIENTTDNDGSTLINPCDFFDKFPGFVEFNDIIRIDVIPYSGHVYDASSLSTVYICNGFLSSNCRCVTIPHVDDKNIPGYIPELKSGRDAKGKSVLFREDITYQEWYEQYGKELEKSREKQ